MLLLIIVTYNHTNNNTDTNINGQYNNSNNSNSSNTCNNHIFANFADDGEHSLVETNVYYTRLAEQIGKMWATNPRSPQGHTNNTNNDTTSRPLSVSQ